MIIINRDELIKKKGYIDLEDINIDNIEYDELKVLEILVEMYLNEVNKDINQYV